MESRVTPTLRTLISICASLGAHKKNLSKILIVELGNEKYKQ